jgi:hypothetical protein
MKLLTGKRSWSIVSFAVIVIIAAIMVCSVDAKRASLKSGEDLKGIAFDDFWNRVKDEGRQWAGSKPYVSRISAVLVDGFDKHNGLSAIWEAQVVLCNSVKEHKDPDSRKTETICSGKSITYRMAEAGITGVESGFHKGREQNFRGAAILLERIRFGARNAEEIANSHKRFRPVGYEYYTYDLHIGHVADKPVWVIKKGCNHRGLREKQCTSKDSWVVRVDAETGEIRIRR